MAALMMAACSNNENEPQVNDGRIAVSFAGGITLTRATTDAWEANDGIGIYMLEHGTKTVADGAANREYVTNAGDGKFTPAEVEQTIYFPLIHRRRGADHRERFDGNAEDIQHRHADTA